MFALSIFKRANISISHCLEFSSLRHASKNSFSRKKVSSLHPRSSGYVTQTTGLHTLIKPLVFTVCFSSGVFVCAAVWQYEEMRRRARRFRRIFGTRLEQKKSGPIRRQLSQWWNSYTEGRKVALVIIAINVCVFLMWRIPALQPFMVKYFAACPTMKGNCLPMILSTFSHYSLMHLIANMYVLDSFSTSSVMFFGKEQFVALYLSAGVIASFVSYVHKIVTGRYGPSLGASGALMAILSSSCFQFPQTQLALVFFPFFTISAGKAIKIVMTLDFIGVLAKWKVFDHAAHLGGACLGIFYLYYGREYIWGKRERLIVWWHNLREKIK